MSLQLTLLSLPPPPVASLSSVFGSVGIGKLSWRLDGNEQLLNGSELQDLYKVKVLAEELAYNKSLKQFKMFIIDKPLDPNYKVLQAPPTSPAGVDGNFSLPRRGLKVLSSGKLAPC